MFQRLLLRPNRIPRITHISSVCRNFHRTIPRLYERSAHGPFTNILASDIPPPVQVKNLSSDGILLQDGLLISAACIFLEGKVFLWDVPSSLWEGWGKERFEVFDVVVPKPDILLFGTGETLSQPPPSLRMALSQMGIQLEVMDTRNACSTYNLLSEEGRRVAAALLPYSAQSWHKSSSF
ncbi:hypothetical protein JAAARDRAFT_118740 [Jaapia argillacea MUCL 33604]|uniref:NADH dehydrogenase [ubiquinone] 1 alpha subcomplex assembly factor 3 n=1 Tax=Jaapia argillacea MUCL 33604 TaxID=933084 RepID=A0A067QL29_9AGAM|nr:hypothetical protein JAAARDRAFT_118740 [Jaapia argillacea MUCL 33604]